MPATSILRLVSTTTNFPGAKDTDGDTVEAVVPGDATTAAGGATMAIPKTTPEEQKQKQKKQKKQKQKKQKKQKKKKPEEKGGSLKTATTTHKAQKQNVSRTTATGELQSTSAPELINNNY